MIIFKRYCFVYRGILEGNKMVVFRECYGYFYELRSLVLNVKMIVLIVIVIKFIKEIILNIIFMEKLFEK